MDSEKTIHKIKTRLKTRNMKDIKIVSLFFNITIHNMCNLNFAIIWQNNKGTVNSRIRSETHTCSHPLSLPYHFHYFIPIFFLIMLYIISLSSILISMSVRGLDLRY